MPRLGLGRNLSIPRRPNSVDPKAGAHTFNGTTTRVQLTNAMTLQDFTIMCWVKYTWDGLLAVRRIVDFRDGSLDGVVIAFTTSTIMRSLYNAVNLPVNTVDSVWFHVAYTANTTTDIMTVFLNGASAATLSIAGTDISTTTAGRIGCNATSIADFYKGQLAQMAIFNTALSAATISGLMNKTYSQLSAGDKTNLVSWWALTNISGTSVPDLHGTNTGTLTP